MGLLVVASILTWYFNRDTLPSKLRIATGSPGGLYHELGGMLSVAFERNSGHPLEAVPTAGTVENRRQLVSQEAHAALLQGGAVSMEDLSIIAPLYADIVHVVVRRNRGIEEIENLAGRTVVLGPKESGMRMSAMTVLRHYRLEEKVIDMEDHYFLDLLSDAELDAAIVTTGILNRDLDLLMRSGEFGLLSIRAAAALETKDPFLYRTAIPRGLYHEGPPIPAEEIETVATTTFLATHKNASDEIISGFLSALYEEGIPQKFPNLIPHGQANSMSPIPIHKGARQYFNPPDQIGILHQVMEVLAAFKELFVAALAGCWLLWNRWKRHQAKELEVELQAQKDHLDTFLEKTLMIERAQMDTTDAVALKSYLDDVTRIKLDALNRLTHEEMRGDETFSIFLAQCANLISKIQFKIMNSSQVQSQRRENSNKRSSSRKKPAKKESSRTM